MLRLLPAQDALAIEEAERPRPRRLRVERPMTDFVADGVPALPAVLLFQPSAVPVIQHNELLVGDDLTGYLSLRVVVHVLPQEIQLQLVEQPLDIEAGRKTVLLPELGSACLDPLLRDERHDFGGVIFKRREMS